MGKKILWILTGGTFSCPPADRGLAPLGSETQARHMLEHCGITGEITAEVIMNKDSSDICPADWKVLAERIDKAVGEYDGIIITHGTDTLGYTAAAMSAMLENPPVPVILTGSQLPFFAEGSDAPQNLTDAFAAVYSGIKAVAVTFCGRLFYGCDVYKADSAEFDGFRSRRGDLGCVKDGQVTLTGEITEGEYIYHRDICDKVTALKLTPAFDGAVIDFLVGRGIRGIVLECYGSGGIPEFVLPHIKAAAEQGVKFIAVSECVGGAVDLTRYEVGVNAAAAGVSGSGNRGAAEALAMLMTENF
ncbi:MAG: asparaginase [Eubacterium sp.]|nr:asparaginase [Eubacterium sp.]